MAASGIVSASAAKRILGRMMATGGAAAAIAAADGLLQESGAEALDSLVDATLADTRHRSRSTGPGSARWPGSWSAR